jgi:hypothetical protein
LAVVQALDTQPTALTACRAAGVTEEKLPSYRRALAMLAGSGMVAERDVC